MAHRLGYGRLRQFKLLERSRFDYFLVWLSEARFDRVTDCQKFLDLAFARLGTLLFLLDLELTRSLGRCRCLHLVCRHDRWCGAAVLPFDLTLDVLVQSKY